MVHKFKKSRGRFHKKNKTLAREILRVLLVGGATLLVLSSPYAASQLLRNLGKEFGSRATKENFSNAFYYLKRKGFLNIESHHGQTHMDLTEKGKEVARNYAVLQTGPIKCTDRWDRRWFIVLFDISTERRLARDALRFMLKRLGFVHMQKSAWLIPFECEKEVTDLTKFFGLSDEELRLVVSNDIGDDTRFRRFFNV